MAVGFVLIRTEPVKEIRSTRSEVPRRFATSGPLMTLSISEGRPQSRASCAR